jgi:mRNA-degrading endonuclease RelE of RelBE toxin-antitoxin system
MSYKIIPIFSFEKQLKRLVKKYPSLKTEFKEIVESLSENPLQGTSLGNSCYKLRISIKSKGKGKSGGARIITHVFVQNKEVYLLSIYDKSEIESISEEKLFELLKQLP